MKRGLFLYGANCTLDVWENMFDAFKEIDVTYAKYPHDITINAKSVSDITRWCYEEYRDKSFDFIVGHSMGGIIALELVSVYKVKCSEVVFIESNLRPAKEFYRNLMLPDNMEKYGDKIIGMIKKEDQFYSKELMISLQKDFNYTKYLSNIHCKVYGVYGNRGIENYDMRTKDLCLDSETESKIEFMFVRNSCHMPMIENPEELIKILIKCIS